MENNQKDERYLNITLKNEEENKDEVVISFSGIFKKLKKYFLVWLVTAVVAVMLVFTGSAVTNDFTTMAPLTSLVSFTYKGIEKGLDPAGNEFDINSIKNPAVIKMALTELNLPLEKLEDIRQHLSFEGIVPSDAIDKITAYKSLYQDGSMAAAQAMLDTTYYPTEYKVSFNYAPAGFSNEDGAKVLNTLLNCYGEYFFETYGYNEALGSVVTSLDYNDYDYSEAIDVFDSTLTSVQNYIEQLSRNDTSRFRSSITGYTFADLAETVSTLQDMDLEILSSYIIMNNVTKDKNSLLTYYEFRIDTLTRDKVVYQEKLKSINDSISSYQKDSVMVYGDSAETNSNYTLASEAYDKLFDEKTATQTLLSRTIQNIDYYNTRLNNLKSKPVGDNSKIDKVENDFKALKEKVNVLIENVNKTANDYYETVSFANAYNVLVPASSSTVVSNAKHILKSAVMPILIAEALILVVYIGFAFVTAVIAENKKKNLEEVLKEKNEKKEKSKEKDSEKKNK